MRLFRRISAIVWLVCLFSGVAKGKSQDDGCKQPFDRDTGSTLQSIEDILVGFVTPCAYTHSSNTAKTEAQMRKYVVFYLLSSDGETYNATAEKDVPAAIQPDIPTYIIIHGFDTSANPNSNSWMPRTGQQLRKNQPCNVILMDYGAIANCSYIYLSIYGVPDMGLYLKDTINSWNIPLENIQIIGHSIGAHIGGVAGIKLGGQLARLTGLDPAAPLISEASGNSLTIGSARFVQILHTSALGIQTNIGHADFFANKPIVIAQPGCATDDISCSHSRSTELYFTSTEFEGLFVGTSSAGDTAVFGWNSTEIFGSYDFTTTGCYPYEKSNTV